MGADKSHKHTCSLYVSTSFTAVPLPQFAAILEQASANRAPAKQQMKSKKTPPKYRTHITGLEGIPTRPHGSSKQAIDRGNWWRKANTHVNRTVSIHLTRLHTKIQYSLCNCNEVMLFTRVKSTEHSLTSSSNRPSP